MKKIPRYEGYFATRDGKIFSAKSQAFLKQFIKSKKTGYLAVNLYVGGSGKVKFKQEHIHTLVLEAFVGERPDGYHAAHLDGSRDNNHIDNLKWATVHENMSHKKLHGTNICGEHNNLSKLKNEQVIWLRDSYIEYNKHKTNIKELASKLGIHSEIARKIVRGELWAHIEHGIRPKLRKTVTESDVAEIKKMYRENPKITYVEIAKKYPITPTSISSIINGKTWKHVKAAE